jgi:hypothetical protein
LKWRDAEHGAASRRNGCPPDQDRLPVEIADASERFRSVVENEPDFRRAVGLDRHFGFEAVVGCKRVENAQAVTCGLELHGAVGLFALRG